MRRAAARRGEEPLPALLRRARVRRLAASRLQSGCSASSTRPASASSRRRRPPRRACETSLAPSLAATPPRPPRYAAGVGAASTHSSAHLRRRRPSKLPPRRPDAGGAARPPDPVQRLRLGPVPHALRRRLVHLCRRAAVWHQHSRLGLLVRQPPPPHRHDLPRDAARRAAPFGIGARGRGTSATRPRRLSLSRPPALQHGESRARRLWRPPPRDAAHEACLWSRQQPGLPAFGCAPSLPLLRCARGPSAPPAGPQPQLSSPSALQAPPPISTALPPRTGCETRTQPPSPRCAMSCLATDPSTRRAAVHSTPTPATHRPLPAAAAHRSSYSAARPLRRRLAGTSRLPGQSCRSTRSTRRRSRACGTTTSTACRRGRRRACATSTAGAPPGRRPLERAAGGSSRRLAVSRYAEVERALAAWDAVLEEPGRRLTLSLREGDCTVGPPRRKAGCPVYLLASSLACGRWLRRP